jgi:phytoene synthase
MSSSRPASVPDPAPGSTRFFTLLYAPHERRAALRALLALSDEIGAGLGRQLDHGVAHIRLEWWRHEAQRFAAGEPAHPWLIAWQRERCPALDLALLVEAAAIDLASQHLAASASRRLPQTLFVLAARVLLAGTPEAALTEEREEAIAGLGRAVDEFERPAASDHADPPALPAPALQRALAPLLVWAALAAHQARQQQRRAAGKSQTMARRIADGIIDNVVAWRAARAARRGHFPLEELLRMRQ